MSAEDLIKWGLIGFAGWWIYETFFAAPSTYTVKQLPTGSNQSPAGTQVTVSDGTSATDCTVGGGTTKVVCQSVWNGTTPEGWVAVASLGTSGGSSTGGTPSGQTPTKAAGSFTSLDAMYKALVAAAQAAMPGSGGAITSSGGVLSADGDVWNYYLSQIDPSIDTSQLDPTVIFGSTITSANRSTPVTSSAYWAAAGPIIGKQTGLSGYLHGLGAIVYGGRRRRRVA